MKTVFAVSTEDDNSGMVEWYYNEEFAALDYNTTILDPGYKDCEVNLFAFEVPNDMSAKAITDEADSWMWHRNYVPIRWRAGKDHSATPHATPPTDVWWEKP